MKYKEVFKIFSQKEGSLHIASQKALEVVELLIIKNKVKSVFEFGIGIGTIPFLLNSLNSEIIYFGTEDNEFCKEALKKNLEVKNSSFKFHHLENYNHFNQNTKFDLIIIDGSFDDCKFIKNITKENSVLLIEGDRKEQRLFLKNCFPNALISTIISNKKNPKYSPFYSHKNNPYIGGCTVFRLNNSLGNKIDWFFEKLTTFVKYKIRKG